MLNTKNHQRLDFQKNYALCGPVMLEDLKKLRLWDVQEILAKAKRRSAQSSKYKIYPLVI